jgi:hypothetical protein
VDLLKKLLNTYGNTLILKLVLRLVAYAGGPLLASIGVRELDSNTVAGVAEAITGVIIVAAIALLDKYSHNMPATPAPTPPPAILGT